MGKVIRAFKKSTRIFNGQHRGRRAWHAAGNINTENEFRIQDIITSV